MIPGAEDVEGCCTGECRSPGDPHKGRYIRIPATVHHEEWAIGYPKLRSLPETRKEIIASGRDLDPGIHSLSHGGHVVGHIDHRRGEEGWR